MKFSHTISRCADLGAHTYVPIPDRYAHRHTVCVYTYIGKQYMPYMTERERERETETQREKERAITAYYKSHGVDAEAGTGLCGALASRWPWDERKVAASKVTK